MPPNDPFQFYPHEERLSEAPNWYFDSFTSTFIRFDGVRVQRDPSHSCWRVDPASGAQFKISTVEVKGYDDLDALRHVDRTNPCPSPPPAVGQVWSDGTVEFMILGAQRVMDPANGTIHHIVISSVSDETVDWESSIPEPAALLYGPNAPWTSPGWFDRGVEDQMVFDEIAGEN